MSKEIAQTVSGPKIAWLLAIVAAFAVLATLGTQWRSSEAGPLPTTTGTISQSPAAGSVIEGTVVTYTGTATTTAALSDVADQLAVNVTVPAGFTFLIGNVSCTGVAGGVASVSGQVATCTWPAPVGAGTFNTIVAATATTPGATAAATGTVCTVGAAPSCQALTAGAGIGAGVILDVDDVPSLFHVDDDGDYILVQEVANNVRGSRHTACMGLRVFNGTTLVDVLPFAAPGGTNFATHFTNQPPNAYNGPQPVTPQSPTANDVSRFVGNGSTGPQGASCFSWYSLGAGDQIVTASYVEPPPPPPVIPQQAAVDVVFDRNLPGQRGLVKEWNVLEDSVVSAQIWTPGTGSQTAQTSTQNLNANPAVGSTLNISLPLYVDVLSGQYNFNGTVTIRDAFGGSHVNSGGQLEDFPTPGLVGVSWTATANAACANVNGLGSGVTALDSTGSTSGLGFTVVGEPLITVSGFSDCVLGDEIIIEIRGSEGALGSGTGLTVLQRVRITFTIPPPSQKQVFLAWAGQRIILEHDWRVPAGDVNNPSTSATYPNPLGTCFGTGQTSLEGFQVTYIKGSGPGNFLPGYGAVLNGSDQATVEVGLPATQNNAANTHCISRVLFESEDQGQVDIEAFILGQGSVNVTKHAFVIYYMKINSVTTSLVTQVSKPNHNSTSAPDYAPGNPWNSSLDDADGAAEWNVSKDILARVRVTGWFLTTNPSGRPADTSNPLNILPANRWVMPDDWAQLHGGPVDVDGLNDTQHRIGTAEEFRSYFDLMFAPNNTSGIALANPTGSAAAVGAVVAAGNAGTGAAAPAAAISVNSCALLPVGTSVAIGTTSLGTVTSCSGTALRVSSPPAAAPAAGTLILIVSGVPFEGPYSLIDIPGLAGQGLGGAALSNWDPGNIRDTILGDGDVDAWDAPMPPAMLSIRLRGTGFLKPVYKSDVYYLGTPNTATQLFPNPYYIQNIPDSPFIPAIVVGGGYLWNSWGNDGPGGNGDGVYTFWQWARTGVNSAGVGEALSAADQSELAIIDAAGHGTVARDAVVYTDNHGEAMVTANGDFKTDLTACATNALAGGKHCKPGDKVGTATITATADYPDFRGKHFPVLSNAVTVDWLWGGYKDVTVHAGETDQFKYVVFHAMDRDGFCTPPTGAISLHSVLTSVDAQTNFSSLGARYNGDPAENVDFLIDSGQGIIIGQSGGGTINDGRQFATGVTTFSVAANNPATSGILEFPLSPLAADGQTDECQAWVKISNSLLGIVNVLTIAHDDEGNIGFDRVIDLTNTTSYTLNFRWSLITWAGANGISVNDALKGTGSGGQNPGGNDISASVTAIYGWNAAAQQWLGYFPTGVNVPGANDLTSLNTGQAYWIAITGPSSVTWTVASNVN